MNKYYPKYEESLFTIRFVGDGFDIRGVSIYDLSQSLLAFQRIVHKAYLAKEGRLDKGAYPNKEEREVLSLQLGERRRASDAFALVPILTDPATIEVAKKVADYVFSGLVGYFVGDVLDRIKKEPSQERQIFIGSIYTEVANIVNRVDASGGVDAISIGMPLLGRETVASFDSDSKEYIARLKDEYFLGDYQEIRGEVYKLYPASNIVAIKRPGGKNVSIFLNDLDFDKIRYHQETKPCFLFKGRPRYALGVQSKSVNEFEADEIQYVPKELR